MKSKSLTATIILSKIKEAREARGLSQEELGKLVGVSAQAISQLERGISNRPKDSTLSEIINKLDFPVSFFTDERVLDENTVGPTFFRRKSKTRKRDIEMVEKYRTWLIRNIYPVLTEHIKFPDPKVPEYTSGTPGEYTVEQITEAAHMVRNQWGLGTGPIKDLAATMELNGILLARLPLGMEIDACSFWYSGRPFMMLSSTKNNYFRARFDEAHDLGHLILHSKCASIRDKDMEKEADLFASVFLMPEDSFGEEIFAVTLDSLLQLKTRWGVSVAAMIRRCQDLGYISEYQASYLWRQRVSRGWRINEPLDDKFKPEDPILIKKSIEIIVEKNILSIEEVSSAFKLNPKDSQPLCNILLSNYKKTPANVLSLVTFKNKQKATEA